MGYLVVINEVSASQVAQWLKYLSANAEDARDAGSIPGQGNGNSVQYFCPETFTDRELGRLQSKEVAKSWT